MVSVSDVRVALATWLVALLVLSLPKLAHAQDPVLSQFYSSPVILNPGLAGITYAPNFAINYRNQWPNFNNAYRTYAVSYDQFFEPINSGVGLYLLADDAGNGILKTTKAGAVYSYNIRINYNWRIKWGIEVGLAQTRLDWDKLIFLDQIDEVLGPISPGGTPFPTTEDMPESLKITYLDLATGGVLYNRNFYFGVALKHLNTPSQSFTDVNTNLQNGLPIRWSVHAGSEIPITIGNNRFWSPFISPGIMFVGQGASRQLNVGTFLGFGDFYGGVWYRHANKNPDAVIGAFGFRSQKIRVTYSYDATISSLSLRSGGAHEVGIVINLEDGRRESIYNDCFGIFR
ncbi:MAG: type IX secretion system membrane protein PorP/SprF [Saprospiraceae bacterium]|nr:type IX secretion system membrane protein PorP/SprF [Saprospiraceae bacterium]